MRVVRLASVSFLMILASAACRPRPPVVSANDAAADSTPAEAKACATERSPEERELLQLLSKPSSWAPQSQNVAAQQLRAMGGGLAARGDFATSEGLLKCALTWLEAYRTAVPPPAMHQWDVEHAWTQIVLVEILGELHESKEALPLARAALGVLERESRQLSPMVSAASLAFNRSQLADVLCEQPQPTPAMLSESFALYQSALQVLQATSSSIVQQVLNNYARCLIQFSGPASYAQADRLLHEAMRRLNMEKPVHPNLVRPLNNLAWLRLLQNRPGDALIYARHVLRLTERRLRQEGPALSENGLISLLDSLYRDEQNLYSVLAYLQDLQQQGVPLDPKMLQGWRELGLATVLWRKQRSLDVLAERIKLYKAKALAPALQSQIDAYIANQSRLAALSAPLTFSGSQLSDQGERSQAYFELSQEIERQEEELGKALAPEVRAAWLGDREALRQSPESIIDAVRVTLPEDTALVELVYYKRRPFSSSAAADPESFPEHYQAFVLTRQGELVVRDLKAAAPIDDSVVALRQQIERSESDPSALSAAARTAFERFLRPLWSSPLKAHPRWLLSLDGRLTQIPIAVLDDGTGPLLMKYVIGYLEAGRHLLRSRTCWGGLDPVRDAEKNPVCVPHRDAVLMADPDYGQPMHVLRPGCPVNPPVSGMPKECIDPLPQLPGSRHEAEMFHRYLPGSQLLTGKGATKQALLALRAPGLLLISTHGKSSIPGQPLIGARGGLTVEAQDRLIVDARGPVVDPYLRSVLAFAGARTVYRQPPLPGQSDGVLSAREVLSADLQGTQLVVLSACETGLGDIRVSQGVVGHRRAFLAAGSETVVSSLWRVNDHTTEKLMGCFIKQLSLRVGRIEALTNAARAIKGQYGHPYYWAPFIATGERRPLDGFVFTDGSEGGLDPCVVSSRGAP